MPVGCVISCLIFLLNKLRESSGITPARFFYLKIFHKFSHFDSIPRLESSGQKLLAASLMKPESLICLAIHV